MKGASNLGVAAGFGGLCLLGTIAAAIAERSPEIGPSRVLLVALIQFPLLLALARALRPVLGESAAGACAVVGLGMVPVLAYTSACALERPLIARPWGHPSAKSTLIADHDAALAAGVLVVLVVLVALFAMRRAGLRAIGAPLVRLALGAGVLLSGQSAVRAACVPEPAGYIGSLSGVATIPETFPTEASDVKGPGLPKVLLSGGTTVQRVAPGEIRIQEVDGRYVNATVRGRATVLRDVSHGVWVFAVDHATDPGRDVTAYRETSDQPTDVHVREVASALGPPRAWVLMAGLGSLIAIGIALSAHRAARRKERGLAGVEGRHLGEGAVALDAGRGVVRAPAAASLPVGASVVCMGIRRGSTAYRDGVAVTYAEVVAGTIDDLRSEARHGLRAGLTLAAVTVVVTCTPIFVANLFGLLG